jgi:hypothetical protein
MNCKPGDTAMGLDPDNYGRLCVVNHPAAGLTGPGWTCTTLQTWRLTMNGPDGPRDNYPAGTVFRTLDSQLKPLRDEEGTDEMVRLAGKPEETTKPVEVVA